MTEAQLLRRVAWATAASLLLLVVEGRWAVGGAVGSFAPLLREVLRASLLAVAGVFLLLQPFLLQVFYIPSPSMESTLQGRGRGWRSLLNDRILVIRCWYWWRPPKRGQIVVFRLPTTAGEQEFVKRIVGLPGETVALRQGEVWVNGSRWPAPPTAHADASRFGPVGVPPGHYLVLGDNRAHSTDSRQWGPLPADRIVGRAVLICWPPWRIRWLR